MVIFVMMFSFNGGIFYRYSFILTFYLGKNDIHADWYADATNTKKKSKLWKRVEI
jgi:hypothetical protein